MGYPQLPPDPTAPAGVPTGSPVMAGYRPPSGRTGIAVGVLAVLGGLAWLGLTIVMWIMLAHDFDTTALIVSFVMALVAIDLLAGGIITFLRQKVGIVLVVIGCGTIIVGWVVAMGFTAFFAGKEHFLAMDGDDLGSMILVVAICAVLMLIPAALTMYLALIRSTKLWIQAKPQKAAAAPYAAYGQRGW